MKSKDFIPFFFPLIFRHFFPFPKTAEGFGNRRLFHISGLKNFPDRTRELGNGTSLTLAGFVPVGRETSFSCLQGFFTCGEAN
ncbi:MAG: hypothetical protein ACYDBP_00125 [Leptospirales bacterium]